MVDGVGDGGGRRALRGLAGAERRLVAVDEVDLDLGGLAEPQHRVELPVTRQEPAPVHPHPLLQRPAGRLRRTALELVAGAVGVDHPAEVGDDNEASHPQLAAGLDVGDDGAVGAAVLVARVADPAPGVLGHRRAPAREPRGLAHDVCRARVVEVGDPEVDRVDVGRGRQLVDERLDREDVEVGAQRPHRGGPQR